MRAARLLTTVTATAFVAFAAGHIVENGETTAAKIGASLQSPGMARASVLGDVPTLPRPPIETLLATPLPSTKGWNTPLPTSAGIGRLEQSEFATDTGADCDGDLTVALAENGMIRISLSAPCNGDQPVTLRHAGLSFSQMTAPNGRLSVEVPALTRAAVIEAILQDGHSLSASVDVPEADDFRRVALVWRGEGGMQIHAHEFGAEAGTAGHIWAGAPGRSDLGANAQGGYLTTLGDRKVANATRAEIYTFPANHDQRTGVVRLSVQAEVRNTNCGGMVAAQTLQPDGFGGVVASDLTLRLPDCDKVGEHLVLKNILRDLKIARN